MPVLASLFAKIYLRRERNQDCSQKHSDEKWNNKAGKSADPFANNKEGTINELLKACLKRTRFLSPADHVEGKQHSRRV